MSHQSTTPPDRCIIYTRVSDDKQSGASSQLANARRLAGTLGLDVAFEEEDDGESGDDLTRAGLGRVLAHLEKAQRRDQPIRWLVIDKSDRLSRADSLDTAEVLARMRRLGLRKIATPCRTFDLYEGLDRTLLNLESDHKNSPYLKDLGRTVLGGM